MRTNDGTAQYEIHREEKGAGRVVLCSGGRLGAWALQELRNDDFLIGVDRGALFLIQNEMRLDAAVGDFDSVNSEEKARIAEHAGWMVDCDPVMKDYTDTEMAFRYALEKQPAEIVMIGCLGTRMDHSLANIHLLRRALALDIPCKMIDEHNEIYLIDRSLRLEKDRFPYVSLLPLTMEVRGICLEGFRYPLHDAVLEIGQSLGISNVIEQPEAQVSISSGLLLVMKSKDR